ncbi:MAG: DNA-directed RNA polymerase [Nitrososphaerales archaeon]|nr:DNA-directed RNA polymerase [Nitrososphaerales archaeon]|tara:strand:+ start:2077 stop:2658 length:582 start_codon:yes stop_codon:yes gene_type:complete
MFQIIEVEDVVRVEPLDFSETLNKMAEKVLKLKYESTLSPDFGYVILIIGVKADKVGKILPSDGATYHTVNFKLLTYLPKLQEVVEGEVVEITDFGAFIRIGPTDALLHLSQITDEYLNSDVRQGLITAQQSNRVINVGTRMRVRVTALSLARGSSMGKIGVTCRQPFLGANDWIEEDLKKSSKDTSNKKESE